MFLTSFLIGIVVVLAWSFYQKHKEQQAIHFRTVNRGFQEMLDGLMTGDALILDTETTGLTKRSEIVEISIINLRGEVVFNSLVKPKIRMSNDSKAVQIHGITYEQLKDSPSWKDIHQQVSDIIRDKIIISYNAEFDTRLLHQTARKHGLKLPDFTSECAMMIYSFWNGEPSEREGYKWHKLDKACKDLGVKISGQSHRALTDCFSTLALLQNLKGKNIRERKKFL